MLEFACNQSAVPERINMAIVKNSVVSLHYEMYDVNNQLLDKTEEPIVYLPFGGRGVARQGCRRYDRCGAFSR